MKPSNQRHKPTRVRVAFNDQTVKDIVMNKKEGLKGQRDLWICDDLTQYRSNLAYLARTSKQRGNIADTWTFDNHVFIRKRAEEKPMKIQRPEDIPGTSNQ